MKWLSLSIIMVLVALSACEPPRASAEQCRQIFDRMVELELRQMGFQDPVLAKRRQADLAARFRQDLESCVGRPMPEDAMACVAKAQNTQSLLRDCLD